MANVISLPVAPDGPLAIPLFDGSLLRLVPCRQSPYVLLALYGPRGGNAGGVVLHADRARLLGEWLRRLTAGVAARRRGARPSLPGLDAVVDPAGISATLGSLAVPVFADWWALDVFERGKTSMRRLAVAHAEPSRARAAQALRRFPVDPRADSPRAAVLRSGRPDLERDVNDDRLVAGARSAEHLAILRTLGCRSSVTVPLVLRRRVVGLMTFATAESGRRYGARDVEPAVAFARDAAVAVGNALALRRAARALVDRGTAPRRSNRSH